jgi:hypothetical protein
MQIIDSHNDLNHSKIYQLRLFYLQRPLLSYRKRPESSPIWKDILDFSKDKEVCFIDSAGWIFPIKSCIVESNFWSRKWDRSAKIFDYTKKSSEHPRVIAYAPALLRYCTLDTFNRFLDLWVSNELLLYFDKRLIQHNYLKFNLRDLINNDYDIIENDVGDLSRWHFRK